MLEPYDPEIRQELAAARLAALHRSAASASPGPLRRAVGNAFVRLGLLLGSDRSVPQVAQHESHQEALAPAGASTFRPAAWLSVDGPVAAAPRATELDLAWESAAPFGIRIGNAA